MSNSLHTACAPPNMQKTVLVVLVLGRWLLPKGKLTRDQFSQLMLVYLGMAADIAEIPESFREFQVHIGYISTNRPRTG